MDQATSPFTCVPLLASGWQMLQAILYPVDDAACFVWLPSVGALPADAP